VDPPDQVATKSGEPTGFAVELVREAAKRRGIRLQWVEHPESSEGALRGKAVDWLCCKKPLYRRTEPIGSPLGIDYSAFNPRISRMK
jgi:hypothetical protein